MHKAQPQMETKRPPSLAQARESDTLDQDQQRPLHQLQQEAGNTDAQQDRKRRRKYSSVAFPRDAFVQDCAAQSACLPPHTDILWTRGSRAIQRTVRCLSDTSTDKVSKLENETIGVRGRRPAQTDSGNTEDTPGRKGIPEQRAETLMTRG